MWSIHYQVTINSTPDQVWTVLTDLASYSVWNKYSPFAEGDLRVGGYVKIIANVGTSKQHVNNRVLELDAPNKLCWESLNWYHALVYGVRCRTITAQPDGTTLFREEETMYGPLAGLIQGMMGKQLLGGLRTECNSMKAEVERRNTT
jgi:uncharacterized protein YndB with AHSA1/START domain